MIDIKRKTNNVLMLILIGVMLLFSLSLPVQAATYTYYYENFGSPDASGQNPFSATGEIPYTYTESGWSGGTAGVDASEEFFINCSTTGADGTALFTFNTSYGYDYFQFSFQYVNSWTTWYNHSGAKFNLTGDVGDIVYLKVFGANDTSGNANRLLVYDYAGTIIANVSVSQGRWYRVRINPDYDSWDDNVATTVYDVTGATYIVNEISDLNGNTEISQFCIDEQPASAKVCLKVDSLVLLLTTYAQADITTNYLAEYIFPIVYATAMLFVIGTLVVTGTLTPQSLMTVLIVAIVGFVALMILTSI